MREKIFDHHSPLPAAARRHPPPPALRRPLPPRLPAATRLAARFASRAACLAAPLYSSCLPDPPCLAPCQFSFLSLPRSRPTSFLLRSLYLPLSASLSVSVPSSVCLALPLPCLVYSVVPPLPSSSSPPFDRCVAGMLLKFSSMCLVQGSHGVRTWKVLILEARLPPLAGSCVSRRREHGDPILLINGG